jgi:hypothetical protein
MTHEKTDLFSFNTERLAAFASAKCSSIDLTQENLAVSRRVRAASYKAKCNVAIGTYDNVHYRAESIKGEL